MKNNKDIVVVIPSYNEVENISILLKGLFKNLPGIWVVIVDDSNKKENNKLKKIVNEYKRITLISRLKKAGRGSAVLLGFKEAIRIKGVEYVFEMDSDLAHDPKEMKRFIEKKKGDKYDLIIGSRYLPGGKIINISQDRTILSRLINKFLYFWLGMHLSDHTSGFRLYKKKSIEFILSSTIQSTGFITLSEVAYKLFIAGFKIGEVPITWNYRIYGKSNVNFKELYDSFYFVIKMRLNNSFFKRFLSKKILAAILIFLLALIVRLHGLNEMGRAWDEFEYIEQGYKMDELLLKGDFSNPYFYTTYDHPPLAKYIYGIPAHLDLSKIDANGEAVFNYDYTYARILSVIIASLSVLIVFLLAWEYASPLVGVVSGIIFSMLPFYIGLSQLVSTESILMFLFTSGVYVFIKLMEKFSIKKIILVGIISGLALEAKQSNALLFPTYFAFYLVWFFVNKKKINFFGKRFMSLIWIGVVALITFVALWPMPYFHLDAISQVNQRIWLVKTSPPVVYWGNLMFSPEIYFVTMYFITTPILILFLSLLGLKQIEKQKKWVLYGLILWFLIPFIQSFYIWRAHGIRYIVEIYAPLSIIAGLGVAFVIEKFNLKTKGKLIVVLLLLIYMLFSIVKVHPYYLDYFNGLVGGPKGVYDNKYFELGWWGQGLREAAYYLRDNGKPNSKVGVFVSPQHNFPNLDNQKLVRIDPETPFDSKISYDYIVVNYYHVLREGFDDSQIKQRYKLIYQVKVDGASLVDVYSKN